MFIKFIGGPSGKLQINFVTLLSFKFYCICPSHKFACMSKFDLYNYHQTLPVKSKLDLSLCPGLILVKPGTVLYLANMVQSCTWQT